jgi:uncharacterized protein involved in tolerance to divalent cations
MSSNDKGNSSAEGEIGVMLFVGIIALAAIGFFLPLFILSFPFAMILLAAIDDERPLFNFVFGLVVGFIAYLFLYGISDEFAGLLLGSLGDELLSLFDLIKSYKYSRIFLRNVEFDDLRVYFWLSYPMGILVAFGLKMKEQSKKQKRSDFYVKEEARSFEKVTAALKLVSYPYFYIEKVSVKLANRLFSERATALLFVLTAMSLFYCLVFLTFVSAFSWHIKFGYFLNKGLFVFKFISPWVMNVIKQYFYFAGSLYLLMRLASPRLKIESFKNEPMVLDNNSCAHWGGVYLGKDHQKNPVILDHEMLNHHVHVVGASGFGKTTFLLNIIKEKVDAGEGIIFVDLKGDIDTVCEIASFAKNAGRIDEFEFFSISEDFLGVSKSISLFKNGNALEIKDKLMGAFNYDHVYYKKRIESFLNLSLRALVYQRDKKSESFDLDSIYKLTQGFEHIEELSTRIDNKVIKSDLLTLVADKKLKEDLTGLRADIEGLIKTDFGHLLSNSNCSINFYDSIRESKIVYVHLDSQRYEVSAEKLGRLILQDIKVACAKIVTTIPKSDRNPFTLIVDEFANLATEQFVGFLNKARSSGIGIVIAHQELSDLDVFSPTVRDQVMTNTSTLFSFLQKLPASAETIAGIAGTYRTEKETEQIGEEGLFFKTKEKTGMGSVREVEEYIVHPNMIKELTRGECFMVSKYPYSRVAKVFVNYLNMQHMSKGELMEELSYLNGNEDMSQLFFENDRNKESQSEESEDWL